MSADLSSPRILGKGSIPGGTYDTVTVLGKANVTGDLEARRLVVQGKLEVEGSTRVGRLEVAGKVQFGGSVAAEEFHLQGKVEVAGNLRASVVRWPGAATVHGDVTAEDFAAQGAFTIDGRLQAKRVEVELAGSSRAGEIAGGSVAVRMRPEGGQTTVRLGAGRVTITNVGGGRTRPPVLEVGSVTGDTVDLEATTADRVSGRRVQVGPQCDIGLVEYSEAYEVAEGARVGRAVKTEPAG